VVVLVVPVMMRVVIGRVVVIGGPVVGLVARRCSIEVPAGIRSQVVVVQALDGLALGCVGGLNMLLEVGIVVEGHPTLFTHDILGLEVYLVDVLT
jgi:hypothetical protein